MTELEEQLASPSGEARRACLLAELKRIEQRLTVRISEGVPRNEFADWKLSVDAAVAAGEVLRQWPVGQGGIDSGKQNSDNTP